MGRLRRSQLQLILIAGVLLVGTATAAVLLLVSPAGGPAAVDEASTTGADGWSGRKSGSGGVADLRFQPTVGRGSATGTGARDGGTAGGPIGRPGADPAGTARVAAPATPVNEPGRGPAGRIISSVGRDVPRLDPALHRRPQQLQGPFSRVGPIESGRRKHRLDRRRCRCGRDARRRG
jgi:hypothetical protein